MNPTKIVKNVSRLVIYNKIFLREKISINDHIKDLKNTSLNYATVNFSILVTGYFEIDLIIHYLV